MRYPIAFCAMILLFSLAACGGGSSSLSSSLALASISVSPPAPSIAVNSTEQFVATGKDASGNVVSDVTFIWSSTANGVATINANGIASSVAAGTTDITAAANGVTSPPAVLTVGSAPGSVDISGKWEFSNGMNVNLAQSGSALTGNGLGLLNSTASPGFLVINPCANDSVSGQVSILTVSFSIGSCDTAPPGGYQAQTVSNASGTLMTGGAWGDSFKVEPLNGTYSGSLEFIAQGGSIGSVGATLVLSENQNQQLVGTLTVAGAGETTIQGVAVGGSINLANQEVVGRVDSFGNLYVSGSGIPKYCAASVCSSSAFGQLQISH